MKAETLGFPILRSVPPPGPGRAPSGATFSEVFDIRPAGSAMPAALDMRATPAGEVDETADMDEGMPDACPDDAVPQGPAMTEGDVADEPAGTPDGPSAPPGEPSLRSWGSTSWAVSEGSGAADRHEPPVSPHEPHSAEEPQPDLPVGTAAASGFTPQTATGGPLSVLSPPTTVTRRLAGAKPLPAIQSTSDVATIAKPDKALPPDPAAPGLAVRPPMAERAPRSLSGPTAPIGEPMNAPGNHGPGPGQPGDPASRKTGLLFRDMAPPDAGSAPPAEYRKTVTVPASSGNRADARPVLRSPGLRSRDAPEAPAVPAAVASDPAADTSSPGPVRGPAHARSPEDAPGVRPTAASVPAARDQGVTLPPDWPARTSVPGPESAPPPADLVPRARDRPLSGTSTSVAAASDAAPHEDHQTEPSMQTAPAPANRASGITGPEHIPQVSHLSEGRPLTPAPPDPSWSGQGGDVKGTDSRVADPPPARNPAQSLVTKATFRWG